MSWYVNTRNRTWVSEPALSDDGWERDSTDGTVTGLDVHEVYEGDDFYRAYTGMETELEPPFYVVVASYYTGDSFGSDFESCVVGIVKTEQEANELVKEASQFEGHGELSNGFYVPWNGYFETLITIDFERYA